MLQIIIPAEERWDEEHEEFIVSKKEQKLMLEHSLVSLSKWESKWQVPFLSKKEKTYEETLDYIKCMTITQNVSDDVYNRLTSKNLTDIRNYIESPMTATVIHDTQPSSRTGEFLTSELIYYIMIFEIKNRKPRKKSKSEIMKENAVRNAKRREKYNSKG